jgi:hypothetical protein
METPASMVPPGAGKRQISLKHLRHIAIQATVGQERYWLHDRDEEIPRSPGRVQNDGLELATQGGWRYSGDGVGPPALYAIASAYTNNVSRMPR